MVMVSYPGSAFHQSVGLRPVASARTNTSVLTGARQTVDIGYSWWEADVQVAPMPLTDARAWRLFLGRLRGPVNTFKLPILPDDQHDGTIAAFTQGAGSGYSLVTDGWPVSSTPLQAGDYVTIGDQLMLLDADVTTDVSGVATLQFHSPLRGTVADNTPITTKRPYLLVYIPEGSPILALPTTRLQDGFSFSATEAY